MSSSAELLLPAAYVHDAAKLIRGAKTRVSFICMVVANDESTDELIDALSEAAERGVNVEVAADVFTYGELGGFFLPTTYRRKQSRATTKMSRAFNKSGVKFTWLGKTKTILFTGRAHMKWCVVDDVVYCFGGVNLYQKGIDNTDYMFKIEDSGLADKIIQEYKRVIEADKRDYASRSHAFSYGDDTVLIDGGLIADSIIYRHVCRLAEEAKHIVYVSQYGPTGKLARILKKTDSRLYFNSIEKASLINKVIIKVGTFLTGLETEYTRPPYLHAKCMIFTMPDGRKVAVTGSHNFVSGGSILGVKEIALETTNPKTIAQLEKFVRDYVA
jgi:cardiolipin synthase